MIRISICEDALDELKYNNKILQNIVIKMHINAGIYCFQSGEDLLFEIEESGDMDIIFLDIEMNGMSGLEVAQKLREKNDRVILIFISYHDQYCKDLISVQPYAFIDKPVTEDKLEKILIHALKTKLNLAESYNFSYRKIQYSIPLSEIRFFQSDKRLIYVNAIHKSTLSPQYVFYGSLENVEKDVNRMSVKFLRVRKSYLVNTQYIAEYSAEKIVLNDGSILEISKGYKKAVRQYYISRLKEK